MMNYEMFKENLVAMMNDFDGPNVEIMPANKVNGGNENLVLIFENNVCPSVNLEHVYREFISSNDELEDVAEGLYASLLNAVEKFPEDIDMDVIRENNGFFPEKVFATIVNVEMNQDVLEQVPHRKIMDLAMIYRIAISENSTILVNNNVIEQIGLTEEDLYKLSKKNNLFPVKMQSIEEVIFGRCPSNEESKMLVISNERETYGSSYLDDMDALQEAADRLNDDIYILPSSVNELLAVPFSEFEAEQLADMVMNVNREQLSKEEFLSNQVYYYNRNDKKVTVVTNNLKTFDALFEA